MADKQNQGRKDEAQDPAREGGVGPRGDDWTPPGQVEDAEDTATSEAEAEAEISEATDGEADT